MPRFYFHVDDGQQVPDRDGTELKDLNEARTQAVEAAGAILRDFDGEFWKSSVPWTMHVTDADNRLLFTLRFSADVPSGEVVLIPREQD